MTSILNSALIISILFLFYLLLLKKETFFQWNRIFLIGSLLLATVIPWLTLNLSWWEQKPVVFAFATIREVAGPIEGTAVHAVEPAFNWINLLSQVYLTGLAIFCLRFLLIVGQVIRIYKKGKKIRSGQYNLVLIEKPVNPFSFFNHIYLPASFYKAGKNLEVILNHESVHQRQWHSLDRLLMEVFLVYQWFNPLAWLLRKEMVLVHEFLADRNQIRVQDQIDYQQSLLKHLLARTTLSIGNNFSVHLNQRIKMMNKKNSPNTHLYKYIFLLPLIVVMFFTCTRENVELQSKKEISHIRGIAIDPTTHQTLSGIQVHIINQGQYLSTDSNGFFEFDATGEEYTIIAEGKNYKPLQFTAKSDIKQLELWMASVDNESESQVVYETIYERLSPKIPIKITDDGRIFLGHKPVKIENLENLVRKRRNQLLIGGINEEKIYASIMADPQTKLGPLSDLQSKLRDVPINKLKYYLDKESKSEIAEKAQN